MFDSIRKPTAPPSKTFGEARLEERCIPNQHYGLDEYGLCYVCGGCGDPECCEHDASCFPPGEIYTEFRENLPA